MGCHFLLQEIFLTQGSNPHLLRWPADSFTTEPPRKPRRRKEKPLGQHTYPLKARRVCLHALAVSSIATAHLGGAEAGGILAREILWTEEPGEMQSTESQSVRHD